MTETELQDALHNALESIAEAREEIGGDDDDGTLADFVRDIADDLDGIEQVLSFDNVGLMTRDSGLVVRLANGDEFQITIVQSRVGSDD